MNKISIVIPVYNEATRIADCLAHISCLDKRPFEVIVVDNNSTDDTAAVAKRFDFVRVIREPRQGVVHARNTGFDAAQGNIIGRIDADTRLPADWTMQVDRLFRNTKISAVTGAISYYDLPNQRFFGAIDLLFRRRAARLMKDEVFLQGANMAMRKSAWLQTKSYVCNRAGMHEDFDLAIHLQQAGHHITFAETLRASISARCIDDSLTSFWTYVMLNPKTYTLHSLKAGRHMYPIATLALLFHMPLRVLYRGYDEQTRRFSWRSAFRTSLDRVNPATFTD